MPWLALGLACPLPVAKLPLAARAVPAVTRTIVITMRATANNRIVRFNTLHLLTQR